MYIIYYCPNLTDKLEYKEDTCLAQNHIIIENSKFMCTQMWIKS